ncbi:hypothetical protein Zmor_003087 [Zophobas morio]|uniref:5'-nucleotidase domain-containing protein 1 n=1 Tax=Zophobas morio TaxID=2755281 RepID=A0AA38HM33_9CUCU|nr:hypothetical protein Zmor_003087 [Zophobas morio]
MDAAEKPLSTFKFTDYDCIGFDLDNTLSRYKVGAMIEMEYGVMANFLVEKKGYSRKHLLQPFDHNFILRGLIVDDENGNILRIANDGHILQASHGTKFLQDEEIETYYPNRHWKVSDIFVQDPLTTWNGPYSEKMRTLLDYFDIAASLIFARAIDAIDEQQNMVQDKYNVWVDILDALQNMFNRNHFPTGEGEYFTKMKTHPELYYHKSSEQLLQWLRQLKHQQKKLFLLTGSHVDFASHTALNTIGPNWKEYFDIVVCFAKKPGFFTMRRDFLRIDGNEEGAPVSLNDLQLGGVYSQGNWTDLHQFLSRHVNKSMPKFLYIGDNLIQDIYTPHIHSHCDTVTVCEELEAEGVYGYRQWHPDQHFLVSTIWGSYFHYNNVNTNWYHLMKKHSKLCIPSLEYIAALPIDHTYTGNDV